MKEAILGNGAALRRQGGHPYVGVRPCDLADKRAGALAEINRERDNGRGPYVEAEYYFEVFNEGEPLAGLKEVARTILEHGTVKPWHNEGDASVTKPAGYDENMGWATDIALLGYNRAERLESGLIALAYPLAFFDKTGGDFPLAQMLMALASEPVSAFTYYQAAKITDIRLPADLKKRLPGARWPHRRVREYLNIGPADPIIGTIVKPKTGLTPELFSRSVVEAAAAGARFTKADENMHLTLKEVTVYVKQTVKDLRAAGFDLGPVGASPKGPRFLFAPHITTDGDRIGDYARAAVEAGANALMFSPYYGGGFLKLAEIASEFDVPVYSHTAGMNVMTGSRTWGIDSRVMYLLAAAGGGAFMQLPAMSGYIRPEDEEKPLIIERLRRDGLEGSDGMTLVIAGGLGPRNIGANMKALGLDGRMFLAGTSVYSHPDGVKAGVQALILAYRAYRERGATAPEELREFAAALGNDGLPLLHVL